MHRFLRIVATALITAGLVIALDVGLTLAWGEPLSKVYESYKQNQAEDELKELQKAFPDAGDLDAAAGAGDLEERVGILADRFEASDQVTTGEAIGEIAIPSIDVRKTVIEGTDTASLQKGPGHYSPSDDEEIQSQGDGSAFPGQGKTVGIAGHRTTYGAPFNRMDDLEPGDEITLEMPYATFEYEVQEVEIVDPNEISVVENVGYERLVLSACHPLYSAAQRIITFAKLKEISLFGSGERIWQDP
ncbi:MAG: class E sortase [Actinomycetota bacterium]|nr:class E sortase [Actinomycetota bacterium]